MSDHDAPEQETSGTTRRRFLGATSALAGLAAFTGAATSTDTDHPQPPAVDVERGNYGTVRGRLPRRSGLASYLEVYGADDDDSTVSVTGYAFDDEDPHVSLSIEMDQANLSMCIDPGEARTIAADLKAAADHAEGESGP